MDFVGCYLHRGTDHKTNEWGTNISVSNWEPMRKPSVSPGKKNADFQTLTRDNFPLITVAVPSNVKLITAPQIGLGWFTVSRTPSPCFKHYPCLAWCNLQISFYLYGTAHNLHSCGKWFKWWSRNQIPMTTGFLSCFFFTSTKGVDINNYNTKTPQH